MVDLQRELARLETRLGEAEVPKAAVIDELSNLRNELGRGTDRRGPVQLANVRIASPCKERWADMTGDDRVRVCNGCDRPVFNLSEMTRDEAEAVLATRGITPCVRFYRRADGTVMAADCPTGARRSRRLAVVAAGTTLLGSSAAIAGPLPPASDEVPATADAPAQGDAPSPELSDADLAKLAEQDQEPEMGEIVIAPSPDRPLIEWSTWLRLGYGVGSQAPRVAARTITPPMPAATEVDEVALAADLSLPVVHGGDLRLGAWGEVRTTSGPVIGAELLVDARHHHGVDFDGSGVLVLRAGANAHVITTALGFGYVGSWSRTDPWIPSIGHVIGARLVGSLTKSLDDPRDWSVTVGIEVDPIGVVTSIYHLVSGR